MALTINSNYTQLITQTTLNKTNNNLSTSQQRLSTGLRINSAADDAAGLQIATRLNAQARGMASAMRNTSDSISMLQTAEGALNEMTDIVQRMKDLATLGANATYTDDDRKAQQAEYDELGKELANIVKNTSYAGEELFSDGSKTDGTGGKFSKAIYFQIGSSSGETLSLDVSGAVSGLAIALSGVSDTYTTSGATGSEIKAATATGGTKITALNTALDKIGELRSKFGANINRLNHTSNNLANMRDNTENSRLAIMSTDFAFESANMSKNSMLLQSGISMLKQAGQMPGMAMSLLG